MLLPRYTQGQSQKKITGELQSVRNSAITPAEVANETMAKYGAIAQGANTIADISKGIAEIDANAELMDSEVSLKNELTALDNEVDQRGLKTDASGNVVFDAEETIHYELTRRKEIISKYRDSIRNPLAKRDFDRVIAQVNVSRNDQVQRNTYAKQAQHLEATALANVNDMLNANEFDGATKYNAELLRIGRIGATQYQKNKLAIDNARDSQPYEDILIAENFSHDDAEKALSELRSGKVDGRALSLSDDEKRRYVNQILSRYIDGDKVNAEALKDAQYKNYIALDEMYSNKTLTLDIVREAGRKNLVAKADYDKLVRKIESGSVDEKTPREVKLWADKFVSEVITNQDLFPDVQSFITGGEYSWEASADATIRSLYYTEGLSIEDRDEQIARINKAKKDLTGEWYKDQERLAYTEVYGVDESRLDEMMMSMDTQYAVTKIVARETNIELRKLRMTLGGGSEKDAEFIQGRKDIVQKARLKTRVKNLERIGVTEPLPDGGVTKDWVDKASVQYFEFARKNTTPSDIRKMEKAMDEILRLTGIDLINEFESR